MGAYSCRSWSSPDAHSCERAQVSGKQRYSRGSRRPAIRAISRKSAKQASACGMPSWKIRKMTAISTGWHRCNTSHLVVAGAWTCRRRLARFSEILPLPVPAVPMFPRFALVAALALICGHASAASFGARPARSGVRRRCACSAPMTFYLVRGAPDGCAAQAATAGSRSKGGEIPTPRRTLQEIPVAASQRPHAADLFPVRPAATSTRRSRWATCCARNPPWPASGEPWCGNAASRRRTARSASS